MIVGVVQKRGYSGIESISVAGKGTDVDVIGCPGVVAGAHGTVFEEILSKCGVGSKRAECGLEDMSVGIDEAWTEDLA